MSVDSSGGNHGDKILERPRNLGVTNKELHVAVGLPCADSDDMCKEQLKGVLLASCQEPLTEEVANDGARMDTSLTGGASHDGEVVADKPQGTSFSVKPTVHDCLSCNLPSEVAILQNEATVHTSHLSLLLCRSARDRLTLQPVVGGSMHLEDQ